MEININNWYQNESGAARMYSASCAELGDDAGEITWGNANDSAANHPELLDTEEKRAACRAWFEGFGAWDRVEIMAWSNEELTALLIQYMAGCIREGIEEDGHLFEGSDGQFYFHIGE